jgi:hypothetical protein
MPRTVLAAGARVSFQAAAPSLYGRNNFALDATRSVAGMADVPDAGGHEEDPLAITERYRIR